jgi:hypothetical protein
MQLFRKRFGGRCLFNWRKSFEEPRVLLRWIYSWEFCRPFCLFDRKTCLCRVLGSCVIEGRLLDLMEEVLKLLTFFIQKKHFLDLKRLSFSFCQSQQAFISFLSFPNLIYVDLKDWTDLDRYLSLQQCSMKRNCNRVCRCSWCDFKFSFIRFGVGL